MRDKPSKSWIIHTSMCPAFGLLHSSGLTPQCCPLPDWFDSTCHSLWSVSFSYAGFGWGLVWAQLLWTQFTAALSPHLLPAPVPQHAHFSELSCVHCLKLLSSSGVERDRQEERDRVCSTGPRKKQNKMVHFCCTFLLLLKPGPPAMVCKVQNSNHSPCQQTWDTSAHQHSKEHPQNKCPRGGKQREKVRWGRKKHRLPLPSPLLVLTNEPLASPNYLAQATASSLLSKPRLQPNIRKLAAGSSTRAAGLHIISTTTSMSPKLHSPS